jgi:Transposase IS116/IS110/IS902 family
VVFTSKRGFVLVRTVIVRPDVPKVAKYFGLVPRERSSGEQRNLGHITTEVDGLMRTLLVEAALRATCKVGTPARVLPTHGSPQGKSQSARGGGTEVGRDSVSDVEEGSELR